MQLHDVSEERLAEAIDAAVSAGKDALSVNRISVRHEDCMNNECCNQIYVCCCLHSQICKRPEPPASAAA